MKKTKGRGRPKLKKIEKRQPITIRLPNDIHEFLSKHTDKKTTVIESCIREVYAEYFNEDEQA